MRPHSIRKIALTILESVLLTQKNLDHAFATMLPTDLSLQDQAWIKALCFGLLRKISSLDYLLGVLSQKPLHKKQQRLRFILYIGLYQLLFMQTKSHAAVFETVELTKTPKLRYASSFVNAILQRASREADNLRLKIPEAAEYNHPTWLLKKLQIAYPTLWQTIVKENNNQPPMFLRYRNPYACVELTQPVAVEKIPGFLEGQVSIQDRAAQQAALLLDLQDGQTVLDACAAPGGKTCHILETAQVKLIAVDQDSKRMIKVSENLQRLDLQADLRIENAINLEFPPNQFDRILLDAPCSGTGVIRRHPDILFLRQASDIPKLVETQTQLLAHLWPMLKPQGILLYATCSVLPDENDNVTTAFLAKTSDAKAIPLHFESGHATQCGWQFLPKTHGEDGFYYCKLTKI